MPLRPRQFRDVMQLANDEAAGMGGNIIVSASLLLDHDSADNANELIVGHMVF